MTGFTMILEAVLILLALSLTFSYGSVRFGCPLMAIFSRWTRWILISLGFAALAEHFGLGNRPFWVLALACFLLWGLLETLYNWVAIDALSRSSIPLFPKFKSNKRGNEWPASKRFIQLRETLRRLKLHNVASLVAEINGEVMMRSPIYESEDKTRRVQVLFLPHQSGTVQVSYVVASQTATGKRIVTDNFFLPFGGFYPDNYYVERSLWTRSLEKLLRRHAERIEAVGEDITAWETDPEEDLNAQQAELERVNTRLGFLMPPDLQGEYGKITREGRYRVWKELWFLSYFGRPRNY